MECYLSDAFHDIIGVDFAKLLLGGWVLSRCQPSLFAPVLQGEEGRIFLKISDKKCSF